MFEKRFKKIHKIIEKEFVSYEGIRLPPLSLRTARNQFSDNKDYYNSAISEADRLIKNLNLNKKSCVLDVGCGAGRLAIGLGIKFPKLNEYHGIDVDGERISWCQKNITKFYPNFKFLKINVFNKMYNPKGSLKQSEFTLPFEDKFDIIYLYSVFSHMLEDDVRSYLSEFSRLLNTNGKVFLTAFVEKGVEKVSENPKNYLFKNPKGPLLCVRYDRVHFENILKCYNLRIEKFEYQVEGIGQSTFYLSKEQ